MITTASSVPASLEPFLKGYFSLQRYLTIFCHDAHSLRLNSGIDRCLGSCYQRPPSALASFSVSPLEGTGVEGPADRRSNVFPAWLQDGGTIWHAGRIDSSFTTMAQSTAVSN
jgi:hypothetical protein